MTHMEVLWKIAKGKENNLGSFDLQYTLNLKGSYWFGWFAYLAAVTMTSVNKSWITNFLKAHDFMLKTCELNMSLST